MMNYTKQLFRLIIFFCLSIFSCFFTSELKAQCPHNCPETYEQRQKRYDREMDAYLYSKEQRKKQEAEINDGDDGGLILFGALLIGGAIYSAYQSSTYQKSQYYSRRYKRRFVPRPPAFILGGSIPLHKSGINDEWRSGLSGELKGEFLLLGNRGKYPNFGLYVNAGHSTYRYNLPFTERQYYLGPEFVFEGNPNRAYAINTSLKEEEEISKRIALTETAINLGVSLKSIFKGGFFLDAGAGIKANRQLRLRFAKEYTYLTGNNRIKSYNKEGIGKINSKPYLFNLKDTYLDIGIGKMFQGKNAPFHVKLTGKLFQMDYGNSSNSTSNVFYRTGDNFTPVEVATDKLGYSVGIEMAWLFGRFTR